jgi:acetyl-CoA C-acetyltransferase
MFPKLFARIAEIYMKRYGLMEEQLARVAKNRAHARLNPLAQMRDSALTLKQACTESETNQRIAPPLKVTDCSQITDGGAALVLCSARFLKRLSRRTAVRLLGYGHTTDHLPLEKKNAPDFSVVRKAAEQAYAMAALKPRDIQAAEVHDCFSISEIVAYEILGFAARGEGAKLLESRATALPVIRDPIFNVQRSTSNAQRPKGTPTVNPGGRLMGDQHPVGATGVRQVGEAYRQLTGFAGEPGSRRRAFSNLQYGWQRHDECRSNLGNGTLK